MVGASSRLLLLLTSQTSFFHRRPSALLRLTRRHSLTLPLPPVSTVPYHLLPLSRVNSLLPIKTSRRFHSHTTSNALHDNNYPPAEDYVLPPSHPWPEWSHLLDSLSAAGYFDRNSNRIERTDIDDEFIANENLSMEFVAAATSCLNFARDRPDILGFLPREDVQVVTGNGKPFLFKSANETEKRMRSFAEGEESVEARTVDLMKYVLSYASNPIIYPERIIEEAAESSVRNLLREFASLSSGRPTPYTSAPEHIQPSFADEQPPRILGPNITMKRGDWICPKCNFMNFARNMKCLECEEQRPRRQLTGGEWDCPQCNFFNYSRNVVCLRCECKRPDEVNSQNQIGFGYNSTNGPRGTNQTLETSVNRNFNSTPAGFGTYTTSFDGGQNARNDGRPPIPKGSNSTYPPFVPLPADMFAKKTQRMPSEGTSSGVSGTIHTVSESKKVVKLGEESQPSEKSASQVQSSQTDEDDKSGSWFKKVAQLHDATDLASGIPDEDFPAIMPMRKGENRFVVSKKKDRSLTTPAYKRQQAMEQGSNTNFVPFVPFPPDYFAKKDDKPQPKNTDSIDQSPSSQMPRENSSGAKINQGTANQGASSSVNSHSTSTFDDRGTFDRNASASSSSPPHVKETPTESLNVGQQTPENQNVRSGWTGKSLEGSAVTEPDPLDMSEEAKAERWFRRVAQIKDISELSQIPDEDFPSIMPMRKGVNRFVVSKRKTPLERRLTSPQYRKNLRVVSSDPMKKEGNGSNE